MSFFESKQPNLDWCQIKEVVQLLAVSVAQVEASLKLGSQSVGVLVESFASMAKDIDAIQVILTNSESSQHQDDALQYCVDTQEKIHHSLVAFQFYDRLQQCLQHVSLGLQGMSALIEEPSRLYDPAEWQKLREEIRNGYTSETEKILFDAIHLGKSIEEALALVAESDKSADDSALEFF